MTPTALVPRRRGVAFAMSHNPPSTALERLPARLLDAADTATACARAAPPPRRLPVGAEILPTGVHFRVWAPERRTVEVVCEGPAWGRDGGATTFALERDDGGYFAGHVASAAPGTTYRYRLDGADRAFPDPASRFQPHGPHGPSQVVDPGAFPWTDASWRGVTLEGQVLYELHVGTFTGEGTWAAAARELEGLADLGVTVVEVMPVAEFAGSFGWGYDGVDLFAPTRLYGTPDDMRRFVDRAHALGVGVILDVVLNHLGPDGNYLGQFSPHYFSRRHRTDWGQAINYDGEHSGPVRELFVANAAYWIDEFHLDGLRIDATQDIHDDGPRHVLCEIASAVRAAARGRATLLVAENEPQHARLVRAPDRGGYGLDALWNDDFHHSAMVALTGRREAYYTDYAGTPQELVAAAKWGYLYQGQRYAWQRKRRGAPAFDLEPARFVAYLQNHDQIANSGRGLRVHALAGPALHRAMTALLLLGPWTPMLFQGQEFSASAPFLYFADHAGALGESVCGGRAEFLAQFSSLATPEMRRWLDDPCALETFERCKLDARERASHGEALEMHRDLLRVRREDPVFSAPHRGGVDGAVLGPEALVLRFFAAGERGPGDDDRLLVLNLGRDLELVPAPEPLLAPPEGKRWSTLWSSEDPRYGGGGTADVEVGGAWRLPGRSAVALRPVADAGIAREDG